VTILRENAVLSRFVERQASEGRPAAEAGLWVLGVPRPKGRCYSKSKGDLL